MNYPRKRRTYKVTFWNGVPYIKVSAAHINQAQIIARNVARQHGWQIASIGEMR